MICVWQAVDNCYYFARYAKTQLVFQDTANTVTDFFTHEILLRRAAPSFLLSDRGAPFLSQMVKDVFRLTGTIHSATSSCHPQTNRLMERLNHTLDATIFLQVTEDQTCWGVVLSHIVFAYNTVRQATTEHSPCFLLYARELPTVLETVLPCVDDHSLSDMTTSFLCRA